ncbi:D-alanyl-D-alanine carboxypeptidase family protein (macronuclear) [Tetrahymena thermophila SB210]|uniref:D-alanyl-D-alanine carboxypeptidase family protein n=1 Tax=Tetrahymena thermophila (strain SB210) TaxID=312017 RepID=I7M0I8_TETTS|nr:D-alanyl-D-alanine carboxypeptidase family protein [Tetrahymena thermophila SB210]EAR87675.1 D-alanyl-D-alanine carboxypeptidase family protein [Tetrahymena thermophila SB210]|eukprot:XP_001007920.1 D-alanyl-D-alanine carboxypeptidase family protein [Tetrahymena thermophila SB210]
MNQFTMYENPPSEITCKSWCIYSLKELQVICGANQNMQLQIASLTKMMTYIVVLRFCKKHQIDIDNLQFVVSRNASAILGTSSGLKVGDQISIRDLLFCLMLPSGNDAALCLAENIGSLLYKMQKGLVKSAYVIRNLNILNIQNESTAIQSCSVMSFVNEMNNMAQELGLNETKFSNPHGLHDKVNVSSAKDMAILTREIMKEDKFTLQLCQAKSYQFEVKNQIDNTCRQINLVNTNKLLEKPGYFGMKTGYTNSAGGCLASLFKQYDKIMAQTVEVIIVVLKSDSMENRFVDTQLLVEWYFRQLNHKIKERCKFYEQSFKQMASLPS